MFDFAQQESKGREWADIPLSAGEAPDEDPVKGGSTSTRPVVVASRKEGRERRGGEKREAAGSFFPPPRTGPRRERAGEEPGAEGPV